VIRLRRVARLQAHARPAKNKRPHRGTPCARGTEATADGHEGVGGLHRSIDVGRRVTGTAGGSGTSAREPEGRFHSLAHVIDVSALERAYHRMRKDAAGGVDGVTKEQYGQALEAKR